MISLHQALAFGVAAFVVFVIPGPSVIFVIGRALSFGRPVAMATVIGNAIGLMVIVLLAVLGLGALIQRSAQAFLLLKYLGAAYLVWLGIQAIRQRKDLHLVAEASGGRRTTARTAAWQGAVVTVTNPKGFLLMGAMLPQFVQRGHGGVSVQMLELGLLAVVIGMFSDVIWALLSSQFRDWFAKSPARSEAIGTVGGVSMIGLGLGLAVTGNPH